jgi:ribosomal protein S18 acetylase RimI-like enzyme
MQIEPYHESHLEGIVRLSLRAWAPVFVSIENAMDRDVYLDMHPDWRVTQQAAVEGVCADPDVPVFVAIDAGEVAGFAALKLHRADRIGEIYMIAVDPDFQRRGIASALTQHSLRYLKEAGMSTAMVETGGDPGHAPARATYEYNGFRIFPVARYFKKL